MILINGPQLNYDSNSYSSGRGRAAGQTGTNCGSQRLPEAHLHAGPTVVPRLGPLVPHRLHQRHRVGASGPARHIHQEDRPHPHHGGGSETR